MLAAWLVFTRPRAWGKGLAATALFTVAAMAVQVDMIAAMATNAPLSHRVARDPVFAGEFLLEQVVYRPLFWVALAGMLATRTGRKWGWFLVGGCAAILVLGVIQHPLRLWLGQWFPVALGFNAYRFTVNAHVLIAAGAAWGVDRLVDRLPSHRRPAIAGAVLAGFVPVGIGMAGDAHDWMQWGSFAANWRIPRLERLAASQRPDDPFRIATIQENGLQSGYMNAMNLETADGYINLYARGYHGLWRILIEPYLPRHADKAEYFANNGARVSLYTDDGHGSPLPAANYFRTSLLALLNVRYIVTNVPIDDPLLDLVEDTRPDRWWDELPTREKLARRLGEDFTGRSVSLYRVREAAPRWWLAEGVRVHDGAGALADDLRSADVADLRCDVRLMRTDAAALGVSESGGGTVTPRQYRPDAIELQIEALRPSVLVVANAFSPLWRAAVDGKPVPLVPAYGALWAVAVPAGNHTVTFRYDPPYRP
jgi:hypothetical protein